PRSRLSCSLLECRVKRIDYTPTDGTTNRGGNTESISSTRYLKGTQKSLVGNSLSHACSRICCVRAITYLYGVEIVATNSEPGQATDSITLLPITYQQSEGGCSVLSTLWQSPYHGNSDCGGQKLRALRKAL
ncbi:unnamed protein product, partial [Ectocarpus sp. 4 AP-2014]